MKPFATSERLILKSGLDELSNAAIEKLIDAIVAHNKDHPDGPIREAFDIAYLQGTPDQPQAGPRDRVAADMSVAQVKKSPTMAPLREHVDKAEAMRDALLAASAEKESQQEDKAYDSVLTMAGFTKSAGTNASAVIKQKTGGKTSTGAPSVAGMAAGIGDDRSSLTWWIDGMLWSVKGTMDNARRSWQNGTRPPLPSLSLVREWGRSLPKERWGKDIPPLLTRYGGLLGTTEPLLDLSVAAHVGMGDIAAAEVDAANCLHAEGGKLYPLCASFLGYDPTQSATPAQTPEGRSAFTNKALSNPMKWLKPVLPHL